MTSIVAASIEELPPLEYQVAGRTVRLSIELEVLPACADANAELEYGFLFDVDADQTTGTTDEAFGDLGVDARISVTCDPAAGGFVSTLGNVTIEPLGDGGVVHIDTTVDQLPGVDLRYIAYARDGERFVRIPEAPYSGKWATYEIRRH